LHLANYGAGQLSGCCPAAHATNEKNREHQTDQIEFANGAAGVLLGHDCPPPPVSLTTLRLAAAGDRLRRPRGLPRISSRGPTPCCTPLASTSSRSQTDSVAGRCAISTTMAPRALRAMIA